MKDGIYNDLGINEYHDNTTHISSTIIKEAKKSMKHFEYYLRSNKERQSFFDFGNAFEVCLLDKNNIEKRIAIFDHRERPEPTKTFAAKENKAWKEMFYAMNEDRYIINYEGGESFEIIEQMLKSCKSDPVINSALQNIECQASLFWTDPGTGLKLKTRPDVVRLNRNTIIDVKTCLSANPSDFSRAASKFDYPLQAVTQIEGCIQSGYMESVDNYYWLAVEKTEPYQAVLYRFDEADLKQAQEMLYYVLRKIKKAYDSGQFKGYQERADNEFGVLDLNIPQYYFENY